MGSLSCLSCCARSLRWRGRADRLRFLAPRGTESPQLAARRPCREPARPVTVTPAGCPPPRLRLAAVVHHGDGRYRPATGHFEGYVAPKFPDADAGAIRALRPRDHQHTHRLRTPCSSASDREPTREGDPLRREGLSSAAQRYSTSMHVTVAAAHPAHFTQRDRGRVGPCRRLD